MNKLLVLAALFSSPLTHAAPADTLATANRLTQAAEKDVAYLSVNVENCTRFASTIRERMLSPIAADLVSFRARFQRFAAQEATAACSSRRDLDQVVAVIDRRLAVASTAQSDLYGMTGDEAMTKALSWDDDHPDCRAENPDDPTSTRELRTYRALKLKLTALRAAVVSLKAQLGCR